MLEEKNIQLLEMESNYSNNITSATTEYEEQLLACNAEMDRVVAECNSAIVSHTCSRIADLIIFQEQRASSSQRIADLESELSRTIESHESSYRQVSEQLQSLQLEVSLNCCRVSF